MIKREIDREKAVNFSEVELSVGAFVSLLALAGNDESADVVTESTQPGWIPPAAMTGSFWPASCVVLLCYSSSNCYRSHRRFVAATTCATWKRPILLHRLMAVSRQETGSSSSDSTDQKCKKTLIVNENLKWRLLSFIYSYLFFVFFIFLIQLHARRTGIRYPIPPPWHLLPFVL